MIKRIIKCSAPWCGPCKAYAPIFHKVGEMEEFHDISFEEIDIDNMTKEEENIVETNKVRNIPTTLILDENNDLVTKLVGLVQEKELISNLKDLIN